MAIVIVRYPLVDQARSIPPDKRLERRIWLADRIRRYAEKSLGPRLIDVEMTSLPGVPGPSTAIFLFKAWPGIERDADEADRHRVVKEFIEALAP